MLDVLGANPAGATPRPAPNKFASNPHPRTHGTPLASGHSRPLTTSVALTDLANEGNLNLVAQSVNSTTETRVDRSSLSVLKFPESIDPISGNTTPYVMFKIFETQTGSVDVLEGDQTTRSLRGGANVASAILAGIPGGEIATAAAGGAAAFGGGFGAFLGIGVSTPAGQNFVNSLANGLFTPVGSDPINITDKAKELVRSFALKRNTQQLALAIALFMPDGITSNYNHEYDALSVTAATGAIGFAAQALSAKEGLVNQLNPFISEAASKVASRALGNDEFAKLGLFATTGMVTNPQLETIYTSPKLRQFVFDFRLIPRNATESALIRNILWSLKYFSSPQIVDGTGGRFLVPPAQFEIEFYDGQNNSNGYLFKTKKCVLEGISVDYSPNGFATFEDGAPVETRLQLNFLETSIIDRNAINEGH
jgi:hypothetical protein